MTYHELPWIGLVDLDWEDYFFLLLSTGMAFYGIYTAITATYSSLIGYSLPGLIIALSILMWVVTFHKGRRMVYWDRLLEQAKVQNSLRNHVEAEGYSEDSE